MSGSGRTSSPASLGLTLLLLCVPFEPRWPVLDVAGFEVTLLEGTAVAATLALLLASGRRLLRAPPLPVLLLWAYAGVHLLSAAVAVTEPGPACVFALRMLAAASFASLVAQTSSGARQRALLALAAGATLASVLSVAEAAGVKALDPFLDCFRPWPFTSGPFRRGSAGSENPNLAAAMIAYGLVGGSAAAASWRCALPWMTLLAAGLLATYSRGGLLGAGAGLLAVAWARRGSPLPRAALLALATVAVGFALAAPPFRLRATTPEVTTLYGAGYQTRVAGLSLGPGEAHLLQARVTNTGRFDWPAGGPFALSARWHVAGSDRSWLAGRGRLPRAVAAGDSIDLWIQVRAPERPGRYLLALDMEEADKYWFSVLGIPRASVAVVVGGPFVPFDAVLPPVQDWAPGRPELWRIAMDMWRAHPLLGVGPDGFRRLYGPWAGHKTWDDRVYAASLYLESAATTGTLGLLALGSALAAAIVSAARRRSAAPLGLVVVLAVHGLVDYVLAFTGHYLVLGFAVGAAAAADGDRGGPDA